MTRKVSSFKYQLPEITDDHIQKVSKDYGKSGGDKLNKKLTELFEAFPSNKDPNEVKIKVAVLNTIYATSINFIQPVVNKLVSKIPQRLHDYTEADFISLVDKVSTVTWSSESNRKEYTRCNLSFASKYVHFLSNKEVPIYDSYIWFVMKGYMGQYGKSKFSYSAPKTYKEFYKSFCEFKDEFSLSAYSNYDIDKYLWQHGKNLIEKFKKKYHLELPEAKRILKVSMKERLS